MTVYYKGDGKRALTEAELEALRKAETMPPNYDEDCPELTPEMEEAFREARRRKPLRVSAAYGMLPRYAKSEVSE